MRHVIDAVAAQGRDKDTELLHVTKNELAGLDAFKRQRTGSGLSRNPKTGLHEAGWFDQYVVPVLPAVAGLAAGAMTGGTMAAPAAALAGAATGAGTKVIQGGSTQDALMGGVLGGIAGYGAAGIGEGLATAGGEALAKEGVGQAAVSSLGETGATQAATTMNAMPNLAQSGSVLAEGATPAVTQGATNAAGVAGPLSAGNYGITQTAPNAAATLPTYGDKVGAGITSIGSSPSAAFEFGKGQMGNVGSTAMGTMGLASLNPADTTDTTTEDTGPNYRGEVYYDANGFRRTRAVPLAAGGAVYGQYDGVEEAADGGYIPGDGLNFAGGGIASFAKGRYLQGPGDGMSDSIKANIDGQQEARLATGEFVVPADVVSHLGNGDSSAGAKQLHKMMDRARMARTGTKQQGKQINPQKVMPA